MENIVSDNTLNNSSIPNNSELTTTQNNENKLPYIIDGQAIVGNTINIKYIGSLIEDIDKKIFIHYGYGLLWENSNQLELNKGDNNTYYTSIKLESFDSFSFCFRDENNNWDINNSGSYSISIQKEDISVTKIENELPFIPEDLGFWNKIAENIKKFFWNFFKKLSIPNKQSL